MPLSTKRLAPSQEPLLPRATSASEPGKSDPGSQAHKKRLSSTQEMTTGLLSSELSGPLAGRPETQGSTPLYPICSLSGSQRQA